MAPKPLFIIPDLFLHFSNELCYGYLMFEGNGKIPLGKQEKSWLSQFSFAKLRQPTPCSLVCFILSGSGQTIDKYQGPSRL